MVGGCGGQQAPRLAAAFQPIIAAVTPAVSAPAVPNPAPTVPLNIPPAGGHASAAPPTRQRRPRPGSTCRPSCSAPWCSRQRWPR